MTKEEAIKELRGFIGHLTEGCQEAIKVLFPELKESEDERIIEQIKFAVMQMPSDREDTKKECLAWLEKQKINTEGDFGRGYDCGYKACLNSHGAEFFEKQKEPTTEELYAEAGTTEKEYIANTMKMVRAMREEPKEQKPVGWSEEDEKMLIKVKQIVLKYWNYHKYDDEKKDAESCYNWLKSLKDRGNFHKSNTNSPIEWSEEDEHRYGDAIYFLETTKMHYADTSEIELAIAWLKSLRPQPHWKPSEEQMRALSETIAFAPDTFKPKCTLMTLQNDLKKL